MHKSFCICRYTLHCIGAVLLWATAGLLTPGPDWPHRRQWQAGAHRTGTLFFFRYVRVRLVRTEDTQSPNYVKHVKPVPGLSLSGPRLSWWFRYGTHILHLDREIVSISLSISLSWVSRLDGFVPWLFEAFLRSALVRCSWPKVELEPPRAKMCGNNWQRLFWSCWHEPQTSCWL